MVYQWNLKLQKGGKEEQNVERRIKLSRLNIEGSGSKSISV
jgi:hypothetical protein